MRILFLVRIGLLFSVGGAMIPADADNGPSLCCARPLQSDLSRRAQA